jgi:hypothetical protein
MLQQKLLEIFFSELKPLQGPVRVKESNLPISIFYGVFESVEIMSIASSVPNFKLEFIIRLLCCSKICWKSFFSDIEPLQEPAEVKESILPISVFDGE